MELRVISQNNEWDWFFKESLEPGVFLQSSAWGAITQAEGKHVVRLGVFEGDAAIAAGQVIFMPGPFKLNYFFCPTGPNFFTKNASQRTKALQLLVEYCKKKGAIFLRCEPSEKLDGHGYVLKKTVDVTPRATSALDLSKSEEVLLAQMHSKTRYNIGLAQKKELRLAPGKDFKAFWSLITETGSRDKFRLHDKKHYEAIFASDLCRQLTLFTTDGQPVATGVFFGFGKTFTYLFGASAYEFRSMMAPYLIQWEAIKLGKALGFSQYDFFGISPGSEDGHHQYAGVTRFKQGFGGNRVERPGTHDLLISGPKYRIYQVLRAVRRLL
jgi:lipid II:glycine glycyltransferase (peptidoglycan interpeptide bridge formation enzyme)